MQEKKKNRIIFIDLMRAFAVLMMVQGHTVDSLLADDYRTFDSLIYHFWFFMRGLTAPIFLFSAGTVFTYLLRLDPTPFSQNARVKKGLKRFLMLLGLGYLLRYPTPYIVYFGKVNQEQWNTFFTVDVLHLIGFGLLFTILLSWVAEKFRLRDSIVYSLGAFMFFIVYPVFAKIEWTNFLPVPVAAYFYQGTGSIFPLFPWVAYLLSGAVLGSYLARNPDVFRTKKFSLDLALFGMLFLLLSAVGNWLELAIYNESNFWTTSPNLVIFRIGYVLMLNSIVSYISISIRNIPQLLIHIGRNTLPIYVVHLVILYGSAWTLGFSYFFGHSFSLLSTIACAVIMLLLMVSMVQSFQVVKKKIKQRSLAAQNA